MRLLSDEKSRVFEEVFVVFFLIDAFYEDLVCWLDILFLPKLGLLLYFLGPDAQRTKGFIAFFFTLLLKCQGLIQKALDFHLRDFVDASYMRNFGLADIDSKNEACSCILGRSKV